MADAAWKEGWYRRPPERGLRARARTWAGWALSQAFYRKEMYRRMDAGFASLEDFLTGYREAAFLHRDAADRAFIDAALKALPATPVEK